MTGDKEKWPSDRRIEWRNPEGYVDTTPHDALTNVMRDKQAQLDEADRRNNILIKSIRAMIDLAGFDLLNRIEVMDRHTGRHYR